MGQHLVDKLTDCPNTSFAATHFILEYRCASTTHLDSQADKGGVVQCGNKQFICKYVYVYTAAFGSTITVEL